MTTIAPTRFTFSRRIRNGCLYSVLAFATCIAICSARCTYGREARIRSWAFFIFEAETISIAFVILRVLCTLLILLRISFDPAMSAVLYWGQIPYTTPSCKGSDPFRLISTRRSS